MSGVSHGGGGSQAGGKTEAIRSLPTHPPIFGDGFIGIGEAELKALADDATPYFLELPLGFLVPQGTALCHCRDNNEVVAAFETLWEVLIALLPSIGPDFNTLNQNGKPYWTFFIEILEYEDLNKVEPWGFRAHLYVADPTWNTQSGDHLNKWFEANKLRRQEEQEKSLLFSGPKRPLMRCQQLYSLEEFIKCATIKNAHAGMVYQRSMGSIKSTPLVGGGSNPARLERIFHPLRSMALPEEVWSAQRNYSNYQDMRFPPGEASKRLLPGYVRHQERNEHGELVPVDENLIGRPKGRCVRLYRYKQSQLQLPEFRHLEFPRNDVMVDLQSKLEAMQRRPEYRFLCELARGKPLLFNAEGKEVPASLDLEPEEQFCCTKQKQHDEEMPDLEDPTSESKMTDDERQSVAEEREQQRMFNMLQESFDASISQSFAGTQFVDSDVLFESNRKKLAEIERQVDGLRARRKWKDVRERAETAELRVKNRRDYLGMSAKQREEETAAVMAELEAMDLNNDENICKLHDEWMQHFYRVAIREFRLVWNVYGHVSSATRAVIAWQNAYVEKHKTMYRHFNKITSNMSLWNDFMINFLLQMEMVFKASACHRETFINWEAAMNASDPKRTDKLHIQNVGGAGISKSFTLDCIEMVCVPGSTEQWTAQTLNANTMDGDDDEHVDFYHEAPYGWFGVSPTGNGPPQHTEQEARTKHELTSGYSRIRELYFDEFHKRQSRVCFRKRNGVKIVNSNASPHQMTDETVNRFLVLFFSQKQRPNRNIIDLVRSSEEQVFRELKRDACEFLQWIHSLVVLTNYMIKCGMINSIQTPYSDTMCTQFLNYVETMGVSNTQNARHKKRILCAVRVGIMVRAILYYWGSVLSPHKSKEEEVVLIDGSKVVKSVPVPFSLDQNLGIRGWLVDDDPSVLVSNFSLMEHQYYSPVQFHVIEAIKAKFFNGNSIQEKKYKLQGMTIAELYAEYLSYRSTTTSKKEEEEAQAEADPPYPTDEDEIVALAKDVQKTDLGPSSSASHHQHGGQQDAPSGRHSGGKTAKRVRGRDDGKPNKGLSSHQTMLMDARADDTMHRDIRQRPELPMLPSGMDTSTRSGELCDRYRQEILWMLRKKFKYASGTKASDADYYRPLPDFWPWTKQMDAEMSEGAKLHALAKLIAPHMPAYRHQEIVAALRSLKDTTTKLIDRDKGSTTYIPTLIIEREQFRIAVTVCDENNQDKLKNAIQFKLQHRATNKTRMLYGPTDDVTPFLMGHFDVDKVANRELTIPNINSFPSSMVRVLGAAFNPNYETNFRLEQAFSGSTVFQCDKPFEEKVWLDHVRSCGMTQQMANDAGYWMEHEARDKLVKDQEARHQEWKAKCEAYRRDNPGALPHQVRTAVPNEVCAPIVYPDELMSGINQHWKTDVKESKQIAAAADVVAAAAADMVLAQSQERKEGDQQQQQQQQQNKRQQKKKRRIIANSDDDDDDDDDSSSSSGEDTETKSPSRPRPQQQQAVEAMDV